MGVDLFEVEDKVLVFYSLVFVILIENTDLEKNLSLTKEIPVL